MIGLTLAMTCVLAQMAAAVSGAAAYEIGEDFLKEDFWKSDPVLFVKDHQRQHGFKFTSDDRSAADSRREGGVTCFGLPVYESRVAFGEQGGIVRLELMLFNPGGTECIEELRGSDGRILRRLARVEKKMSRAEFIAALTSVRAKLTESGRKAPSAQKERTRDAMVRQQFIAWPPSAIGTTATLTWNYSQEGKNVQTFKPGFIRLTVDGPSKLKSGASAVSGNSAKGAESIAANVVRDPRGDIFVDNVPMVDQGMKGYCAVSSAERVMRYYGLDVDEHEIGEIAGTSAESGTSIKRMADTVDGIGKKYGLGTVTLYGDFDSASRIASLNKEVAGYNKMAKKMKKPAIAEDVYVTRSGNIITYHLDALDAAMDAAVLKEMKTKGALKSKYTKFRKDLRQYVDKGIPLYWAVKLGVYPEADLPQATGGHMRLIIGYNDKKDEILYTDSWGKGHELKRMPSDWAWTITVCMMVMKPSKR